MLSPLTKSESDSAQPHRKWRLRRTLKRRFDYRPIEVDDIKYLWAAYKGGALSAMGFERADMSAAEFKDEMEKAIVERCHAAWTMLAETKKGFIPVGVVLACWAPHAPYLIITGIAWMPWASRRNIMECTVGFFSRARKEFAFVGYALPDHKRMYEVCAMHGIMRRVGTSYVAIPGKSCAVFETRNA